MLFSLKCEGLLLEEKQGKGYRAFLESVITLIFYEYFNSYEAYIKQWDIDDYQPLLGSESRIILVFDSP